jgi:flagellar hook protein FlgE
MSLFGSLFTGVSGIGAESQATAMIANNIANVNTIGFKRSEAAFFSLVTSESRLSKYSPGTVQVNRVQRVDQQGPIQQTSSATDGAISGNGMFPVKRDADSQQEFLYTRSGSFSEDSQGLLRNTAGFVLYGWPLDSQGSLPSNAGDLQSLVPVDVAFLGGLTRPTSDAELALNVDSEEADETLSSALTSAADFTRGLTVFDSLGSAQVLTLEFTKTFGPQATAAGNVSDLLATDNLITDIGMTAGDQFTLTTEAGGPLTLDVVNTTPAAANEVQTIADIINAINNAAIGATAFLGNAGEFVIQRDEFVNGAANTLTLEETVNNPLLALGITLTPLGGPETFLSDDLTATGSPPFPATSIYDNGDPTDTPPYSNSAGSDVNTFPTFQFLPGDSQYNNRGWWQLNIIHPDGTSLSRGLLNFNGDGSLNALPDNDGDIDVNLAQIDWNNGSEPQNIDIDIERFSQFAGNFDVIFSDQNGAELGLRTGVELTREGVVVARFSNGATSQLYKVPLITFANFNGLQEVSGTAYSETEESGEENLREAGSGGAGFVEPSTIEISNVDLADEFAKLIVSQRAFSANTRVISTVDQMTQDLLNLR